MANGQTGFNKFKTFKYRCIYSAVMLLTISYALVLHVFMCRKIMLTSFFRYLQMMTRSMTGIDCVSKTDEFGNEFTVLNAENFGSTVTRCYEGICSSSLLLALLDS